MSLDGNLHKCHLQLSCRAGRSCTPPRWGAGVFCTLWSTWWEKRAGIESADFLAHETWLEVLRLHTVTDHIGKLLSRRSLIAAIIPLCIMVTLTGKRVDIPLGTQTNGKGEFHQQSGGGVNKTASVAMLVFRRADRNKNQTPKQKEWKFTHKGEDEKIAEVLYPLPDLSLE